MGPIMQQFEGKSFFVLPAVAKYGPYRRRPALSPKGERRAPVRRNAYLVLMAYMDKMGGKSC